MANGMCQVKPKKTLVFVNFAAEEPGLRGSEESSSWCRYVQWRSIWNSFEACFETCFRASRSLPPAWAPLEVLATQRTLMTKQGPKLQQIAKYCPHTSLSLNSLLAAKDVKDPKKKRSSFQSSNGQKMEKTGLPCKDGEHAVVKLMSRPVLKWSQMFLYRPTKTSRKTGSAGKKTIPPRSCRQSFCWWVSGVKWFWCASLAKANSFMRKSRRRDGEHEARIPPLVRVVQQPIWTKQYFPTALNSAAMARCH